MRGALRAARPPEPRAGSLPASTGATRAPGGAARGARGSPEAAPRPGTRAAPNSGGGGTIGARERVQSPEHDPAPPPAPRALPPEALPAAACLPGSHGVPAGSCGSAGRPAARSSRGRARLRGTQAAAAAVVARGPDRRECRARWAPASPGGGWSRAGAGAGAGRGRGGRGRDQSGGRGGVVPRRGGASGEGRGGARRGRLRLESVGRAGGGAAAPGPGKDAVWAPSLVTPPGAGQGSRVLAARHPQVWVPGTERVWVLARAPVLPRIPISHPFSRNP